MNRPAALVPDVAFAARAGMRAVPFEHRDPAHSCREALARSGLGCDHSESTPERITHA
jgi:putative hydrolase of the HAD superfamily